nr:hypothetical protein [Capsulimonas corticalis]
MRRAHHGMLLNRRKLLFHQAPRLAKHRVGDADLADIMKKRGDSDGA